jgi:phospholipid/cholesterol/gamma-HCH transport system substrate-binding protein
MKRRDEVLVGVFTTLAVVVGIVGAIWLAQGSLSKGYSLYAKFPWGANLKQGQPVLLVGVAVGFVDDVQLKDDGTLITAFSIEKKYHVPLGTTATVIANGIFGDVAIALTPAGPNPKSFSPGDTVPVGISPPGLASLTARLDTITRTVKVLVDSTQRQLTDSGGMREIRRTIVGMNRLMGQLAEVVALQSKNLTETQLSLRHALSGVDSATVDSTVKSMRTTFQVFTVLLDSLKGTNNRVQTLLDKAEKGDGSIAKLLNDPGLYNDVRRLTLSTDSLLTDFRKNPRKYVNVRIF